MQAATGMKCLKKNCTRLARAYSNYCKVHDPSASSDHRKAAKKKSVKKAALLEGKTHSTKKVMKKAAKKATKKTAKKTAKKGAKKAAKKR